MTLEERIQKYLDRCEPAVSHSHGHNTTFRVACVLWNGFGLSVEQTFNWLQYYNQKCEPPWSLTELRHNAEAPEAPTTTHQQPRGYLLGEGFPFEASGSAQAPSEPVPPEPKPQYDEAYARAHAAGCSQAAEPAYFEARSPKTVENRSAAGFLHVVFKYGETVFITTDQRADSWSDTAFLWTNPDPLSGERLGLDRLDFLRTGYPDVWYLNNPVSGRSHHDERFKSGSSFRCLETIASWRHLVIETDILEDPLWLAILARLPIPIKAIYHSGKRGFHALVRIEADSREQTEQQIASLSPELIRLGADPDSLTPHRLTRLPNCMRSWTDQESGEHVERLQRLIYLNPHPTGQPICELPEREPPWAPWLRWAQADWSHGKDKRRIIGALKPFAGLCPEVDSTLKRLGSF
jgi:hypothetical protein